MSGAHSPPCVSIAGRPVGVGARAFVIAEAGVNHNGDLALAHRLIEAAKEAGADAVKFQAFSTEALATSAAPKAGYQEQTTGPGSQQDMLRRLELSGDDFKSLQAHCAADITFLCSPFDDGSLDLLDALGVPAFKIGSGEVSNTPLLARVAGKRLPVILSTGMATMDEVHTAVGVLRANGSAGIVLLHCVTAYPAHYEDMNLRAMGTLAAAFAVPVGLSDHTMGIAVPIAAVALSACMIEKHLTLDRALPGPDHSASLEPQEFAAMVAGIRQIEAALGDGRKEPRPVELETARIVRKSLHASRDLAAGAVLDRDSIIIARPEMGLRPSMLASVIGRVLRHPVSSGSPIRLEDLA